LAIGLGRAAITAGYKVAFYSTDHLVEKLEQAVKEGTMAQRLQQLSKPKLLIIDEFGYTPLSKQVAPWLFKLINMRYEHRSILITSNKSASEWAQVLGDTAMTTAILDRLLHHSKVILMQGESYRMLQAQKESVLQETQIEWAEQQPKKGAVTTRD
ncbi:ATP-binding protein, partial [Sutterella wadsworthensis]|uniref:ATP-binding protein n=1 Tax=Sutterella wadsworthensis TaxID=40545 RepID=UPI001D0852FB